MRRSAPPIWGWLPIFTGLLVIPSSTPAVDATVEIPKEPGEASVPAGIDPAPQPIDLAHPYGFHQIGLDIRYLVTRPAHLDRNGILKVALTIICLAGILISPRSRVEALPPLNPGRANAEGLSPRRRLTLTALRSAGSIRLPQRESAHAFQKGQATVEAQCLTLWTSG